MKDCDPEGIVEAASFMPISIEHPNAWVGHLPFAYWLMNKLKPRVLVELGTHTGNSYFTFCQSVKCHELPTLCYAVDTWRGDEQASFYGEEVYEKVASHNELNYKEFSRLLRMTFDDALDLFEDGSIDLLHVDGLHTYAAVKHDFEAWLPKLTPNAVILFHDINVHKRDFGVWKLWEELVTLYPCNFAFAHSNGLGVVQVGSREDDSCAAHVIEMMRKDKQLIDYFTALGISNLERFELREARECVDNLDECKRVRAALEQNLAQVLGSRSWRLTTPLRTGKAVLVKGRLVAEACKRYHADNGGGGRGLIRLLARGVSQLTRGGGLRSAVETAHGYGRHAHFSGDFVSPLGLPAVTRVGSIEPELHIQSVDIIVCVHNALADVQVCLESILEHTSKPFQIILVDDGSDEETASYLADFANECGPGVTLLRNQKATGYTKAANRGLRASTAEYVVLLNSDTIVSDGWLDRMIECASTHDEVGIVGPLSNTASWQSVPDIEEDGDWAVNQLPTGWQPKDMAKLIADYAAPCYPLMSFLNGFCLLISRRVIDDVGYFDEEAFPQGYGEENDYCLRARERGWLLVLADDVYVYHAQSKSYSHSRRKELSDRAGAILADKHGQESISRGVEQCRLDRVLLGIRAHAHVLLNRQEDLKYIAERWGGYRVAYVLPIGAIGGGANIVLTEALILKNAGVDVAIINLAANRDAFETHYPSLGLQVEYAPTPADVADISANYDVVVATYNESVYWLDRVRQIKGYDIKIAYYVQDYEPYFYDALRDIERARQSYTHIDGMVLVTKTEWNAQEVLSRTGAYCVVVGASFDVSMFRPRSRVHHSWPERPLRICAMIRPSSPRRAARATMQVLNEVAIEFGSDVEIVLFGVEESDPAFGVLSEEFTFKHRLVGLQRSDQLASLFNEVDIFVDFSTYQAMGLTALEAMACGAAVIVPRNGGASSYARDRENALIVNTESHQECRRALELLITDHELRLRMQQTAIRDAVEHYPEKAVRRFMDAIFS